jgi:hypothetical protein
MSVLTSVQRPGCAIDVAKRFASGAHDRLVRRHGEDPQDPSNRNREESTQNAGDFEAGSRQAVGFALRKLAEVAYWQGDTDRVDEFFESALVVARDLGDRTEAAWSLMGLARLALLRGEAARTATLVRDSLALFAEMNDRHAIGAAQHALGVACLSGGDAAGGVALLRDSFALRQQLGERAGVAGCLDGLAMAAAADEQPEHALRLAGAADALRTSLGEALPPVEQVAHDRWLASMRRAAGARGAAAWEAGHIMPLEHVSGASLALAPTRDGSERSAQTSRSESR